MSFRKLGRFSRFVWEVREGARRQGNVIFRLIFRDIKRRSGKDGHGILTLMGILLEPAVGVIALSLFWYVMRRTEVNGVFIAMFLAVSFTAFAIVRRSIASVPREHRLAPRLLLFRT